MENKIKKEYLTRLNKVLSYIQKNIDKKLTLNQLSRVAFFSPFHFHRIFSAYMGESINSYIRRVKLDNSALKLKYTNESIFDIAFSCGFETSSAYSRAFRQQFGLTPTKFRLKNNTNKNLKLQKEYKGYLKEICMKSFKGIKQIPDTQVLFVQRTGFYRKIFDETWHILLEYAKNLDIIDENTKYISICLDDPEITPVEKLRYNACITFNGNLAPSSDISIKTIQGGKYAVFLHEGSYKTLYQTYDAMLLEWLPNNYDKFDKEHNILRDVPCFEILNKDFLNTKPDDLKTEIYLPVV